jgi:hypothetical protein
MGTGWRNRFQGFLWIDKLRGLAVQQREPDQQQIVMSLTRAHLNRLIFTDFFQFKKYRCRPSYGTETYGPLICRLRRFGGMARDTFHIILGQENWQRQGVDITPQVVLW